MLSLATFASWTRPGGRTTCLCKASNWQEHRRSTVKTWNPVSKSATSLTPGTLCLPSNATSHSQCPRLRWNPIQQIERSRCWRKLIWYNSAVSCLIILEEGKKDVPATSELNTDEVHRTRGTTDCPQGCLTHQTVLLRLVVLKLNCPGKACALRLSCQIVPFPP